MAAVAESGAPALEQRLALVEEELATARAQVTTTPLNHHTGLIG